MAKLTAFGKQMRVLESFHPPLICPKKTKIALYGTEEVSY
jgi:hypothetical protein